MSIKKIFKDGMREFKRQSALRKEKKNLSQKETKLSEQLTQLGQKAWETKISIDTFGNSKELIENTQNELNDLDKKITEFQNQQTELENTKKEKNDHFNDERKGVEDQKKGVDAELDEEKKQLKTAQKDAGDAANRMKQITKEQERLNAKIADPQTPQEEKATAENTLKALADEKQSMLQKQDTANTVIKEQEGKIRPLEDQSHQYMEQINKIKDEQKQTIGGLDEDINKVKKEIAGCNKRKEALEKEQSGNFEELGKKIAANPVEDEAVVLELSAVNTTKKEIEAVEVDIQSLEHQGSAASRGALWKMLGLIGACLVVLIGIVLGIVLLIGPSEKDTETTPSETTTQEARAESTTSGEKSTSPASDVTPADAKADTQSSESGTTDGTTDETTDETKEEKADETADETAGKTPDETAGETASEPKDATTEQPGSEEVKTTDQHVDMDKLPIVISEEAKNKIESKTQELKEQSEKQQGKEIVLTTKDTFVSMLPDFADWKMKNPRYEKTGIAQMVMAEFRVEYTGPEGKVIDVQITDTATVSASLATYKQAFALNISRQTDKGYRKISTYHNIRVMEDHTNNPLETEFVFIHNDRYLFVLKCRNENGLELLKRFMGNLDLSKLQ